MKYAHTNLICVDWKSQVHFYCKVFKCKVVLPYRDQQGAWLDKAVGLRDARLRGAHLRLPGHGKKGPTLELYSYDEMKKQKKVSPNQRGFGHLAFEVENVRKVLKRVIRYGGTANGEIVSRNVTGAGVITFVYARDPEGNLLELQHWKIDKNKNGK